MSHKKRNKTWNLRGGTFGETLMASTVVRSTISVKKKSEWIRTEGRHRIPNDNRNRWKEQKEKRCERKKMAWMLFFIFFLIIMAYWINVGSRGRQSLCWPKNFADVDDSVGCYYYWCLMYFKIIDHLIYLLIDT